jgi:hypothetical protein
VATTNKIIPPLFSQDSRRDADEEAIAVYPSTQPGFPSRLVASPIDPLVKKISLTYFAIPPFCLARSLINQLSPLYLPFRNAK